MTWRGAHIQALGVVAAVAAVVGPVVWFRFLPSQDLPNHMAMVEVLAHRTDLAGWDTRFEDNLSVRPYGTWYGLALLLHPVAGAVGGAHALLALYMVATALGFAWLVRELGGQPWTAVVAAPMVYNEAYLLGFANYLLGLPLLVLGLAALVRWLGNTRSRAPLAASAGCQLALYLTHPLALAQSLMLTGLVVASARLGWRERGRALGAHALPALLLGWYLWSSSAADEAAARLDLGVRLRHVVTAPLAVVEAASPGLFAVAAALLLGLVAIAMARCARGSSRDRRALGLLVGAVATLALALTLPFGVGWTVWLGPRFAVVFWIVALAGLSRWLVATRVERWLAAALFALCVAVTWVGHARFETEARPLSRLIAELPRSEHVASVDFTARSAALSPFYQRNGEIEAFSLYAHFASYYVVACGGQTPWMTFHASLPWMPLGLLEQRYWLFGIGEPFVPATESRRLVAEASEIPLVLARVDDPADLDPLRPRFSPIASVGSFYALVAQGSELAGPRCGARSSR